MMNTLTKKIIATFTAITAMATSLCACSGNNNIGETTAPVADENATIETLVEKQMPTLIEKSELFYDIYLRCNPAVEDYDYNSLPEDENGFKYAPVKNYKSIKELKEDTEKYFTADEAEKMFYSVALEGVIPYFIDDGGQLKVIADSMSAGENKWDTSSAKITSSDDNSAVVYVEYMDIYDTAKSADFTVVNDKGTLKIGNIVYDNKRQ